MDIFDKIIKGEIPSSKVYEDDDFLVILDINPIKKGHCLVIPKTCVATLDKLDDSLCSKLLLVVKKIDKRLREKLNCSACSIFINDGKDAGQEVAHLHVHILPRYKEDGSFEKDKKEKYSEGESEKFLNLLKF